MMWIEYAKRIISQRMAYRANYFISLFTMFIFELWGPILAFVIYTNSEGFSGWTFHEILLVQGILMFIKGFAFSNFWGMVWNTNIILWKGEFDLTLVKPRNILYTFISQSFDAEDIGKYVGGILIIGYAIMNIDGITLANFGLMILCIIFGLMFFFALGLLFSAFLFKVIQTWRVYELLEVIMMFGQYPRSIYPKAVAGFFTSILPVFIASVFPAQALLGKVESDIFISMGVVALLVAIGLYTWFKAIKSYSSAGG